MKNGFSVKLNIGGRLLEYDDNAGLLTCKIPRQMMEDPTKLSFGIISQQAQVTLEDFDNKLRKLVLRKQINTTTKGEIYYNDNLIFYGFVNESSYNDDDNTLELKIADILIKLKEIISPSKVYYYENNEDGEISFKTIFELFINTVVNYFKNMGLSISYSIDDNMYKFINSLKYYKNYTYVDTYGTPLVALMGVDAFSMSNYICNLCCCCMFFYNNNIFFRRIV